ncbi:antibiotic biosynthesis monooxygenase [Enterovibrio sp. Hal110]
MIAVIFEVTIKQGGRATYFHIAQKLKASLVDIDGFLSVERYQNLADENTFLSLSFWRDEEAIKVWRQQVEHQLAQKKGRSLLFDDYRLRVAAVLRDYGMEDREQAPTQEA